MTKTKGEPTMQKKISSGRGGKLRRTEAVTVRLDEKTRYLSELAARAQRRTLSSFIESAVDESLGRTTLVDRNKIERNLKAFSLELWDVDEADRFLKLAEHFPDLLTYEEQVCLKLIQNSNYIMNITSETDKNLILEPSNFGLDEIDMVALRETFDTFRKVAAGKLDKSALPK